VVTRPPGAVLRALLGALVLAAGPAVAGDGSTGLVPLTELGAGSYQGFEGGLYPGGASVPPPEHVAAALVQGAGVVPRDAAGAPDPSGKVVFLSIGMSNVSQEWKAFERRLDPDPGRDGSVLILNGAIGGQAAENLVAPDAPYWQVVEERLAAAGATPRQVQACWLKEAQGQPDTVDFPAHAQTLRDQLRAIVRNLRDRFPHLALCYLSSRIYGGHSQHPFRNEPISYETGWSVKWLIEGQLDGDPELNYDPEQGPVEAPLLLWGPYLWADGVVPRGDGLRWLPEDMEEDGHHPGPTAEAKVADLLQAFFAAEPSAAPWWRRSGAGGLTTAAVDAGADATLRAAQPNQNFGADPELEAVGIPNPKVAYLRFDTGGVDGEIRHAKISLITRSLVKGELVAVADGGWREGEITWNNAPPLEETLGAVPRSSRDSAFAGDLTARLLADGDGVVTVALRSETDALRRCSSREGGEPPRLILTLAGVALFADGFESGDLSAWSATVAGPPSAPAENLEEATADRTKTGRIPHVPLARLHRSPDLPRRADLQTQALPDRPEPRRPHQPRHHQR
jgi:hypothetical protein